MYSNRNYIYDSFKIILLVLQLKEGITRFFRFFSGKTTYLLTIIAHRGL